MDIIERDRAGEAAKTKRLRAVRLAKEEERTKEPAT
jgi:hypothetical protein